MKRNTSTADITFKDVSMRPLEKNVRVNSYFVMEPILEELTVSEFVFQVSLGLVWRMEDKSNER